MLAENNLTPGNLADADTFLLQHRHALGGISMMFRVAKLLSSSVALVLLC